MEYMESKCQFVTLISCFTRDRSVSLLACDWFSVRCGGGKREGCFEVA